MDKQKRQLFLLLGILVLAVVAFIGINKYNEYARLQEEEETTIRVFNHTDITKITYGYNSMQNIVSMQKIDGEWTDINDSSVELDSLLVDAIISIPSNIEYQDKIEGVTDFEQYGLENPSIEIICYSSNNEYLIQVGNFSASLYKYYIRINNEDIVYTVDNTLYNTFTKSTASFIINN